MMNGPTYGSQKFWPSPWLLSPLWSIGTGSVQRPTPYRGGSRANRPGQGPNAARS